MGPELWLHSLHSISTSGGEYAQVPRFPAQMESDRGNGSEATDSLVSGSDRLLASPWPPCPEVLIGTLQTYHASVHCSL